MKTLRDMTPEKFWRSPDVAGFVEKIAAAPDDDLPRMVFADWLQDTAGGDVDNQHAEFIREQLANPYPAVEGGQFVPPPLRARVYAGFSLKDVYRGNVPLSPRNVFAWVDRGFLSRCQFRPDRSANPFSLHDWIWAIERKDARRDVFTAGIIGTGFGLPIGRHHPFWFELDNPDILGLSTFRGIRVGEQLAADYLGERYLYDLSELRQMGEPKAGEHVIRETLTRFWEGRLERIKFPCRVKLSGQLLAHVNDRIRIINPV